MSTAQPVDAAPHPTAVHLGFAGSRQLWPPEADPEQIAIWRAQALEQLVAILRQLREDPALKLHAGHFFVGLAQVAAGADQLFADACTAALVPLRVLLPQTRDEYLEARGSTGDPDFDDAAKAHARRLLDSTAVIHERVASTAAQRHKRFAETNAEIVRLADLVLTLQRAARPGGKPGGTDEFAAIARRHRRPVCAVTLEIIDGRVQLNYALSGAESFVAPRLPKVLDHAALQRSTFIADLKDAASGLTKGLKERFEFRMRVVIWTHVLATGLAAAALALSYLDHGNHGPLYQAVPWLLLVELLLLGWGLYTHYALHHQATTHAWVDARLCAEILRSAQTLCEGTDVTSAGQREHFAGQHTELRHLSDVPLPPSFRGLTRTLEVVHLQATRGNRDADHRLLCQRYVRERLRTTQTEHRGQIPYFERELADAEHSVRQAHRWFLLWAGLAILVTSIKLVTPWFGSLSDSAAATMSWLAICLPVLAVAVMSISANMDKEARASNYREMLDFLRQQGEMLDAAGSEEGTEPEFLRLQAETEARLLSEAVNWYYRRRFINPV